MSYNSEKEEVDATVTRLLDNLGATASSRTGRAGIELRQAIGDVRANYVAYLRDDTFADKLLNCFTVAVSAGAKLESLRNVHVGLFAETPAGDISSAIVQAAIVFCLSAESRVIVPMEFTSRDDVEKMIASVKSAFDIARELASDAIDTSSYMALTYLAGALTNHLATVSRPLPRMITFTLNAALPALTLSNFIYHNAERWEEIVAENHIIHPAFCMREIVGLSS